MLEYQERWSSRRERLTGKVNRLRQWCELVGKGLSRAWQEQ